MVDHGSAAVVLGLTMPTQPVARPSISMNDGLAKQLIEQCQWPAVRTPLDNKRFRCVQKPRAFVVLRSSQPGNHRGNLWPATNQLICVKTVDLMSTIITMPWRAASFLPSSDVQGACHHT